MVYVVYIFSIMCVCIAIICYYISLQVVFLAEDRAVYVVLVCLEASLEVCQVEFQEALATAQVVY
jgi:hypothetical protein